MSKSEKLKWQNKLKDRRLQLDIESKKNIRWIIIMGGLVFLAAILTRLWS